MDKSNFRPDTRCTVTLRDDAGRVRPADLYVFRVCEEFLIVRTLEGDGLLRKIRYGSIDKLVEMRDAGTDERYRVPAALLEETVWRERSEMALYATSPRQGK